MRSTRPSLRHINDPRQLLDPIKQEISLLDQSLVLGVLRVWPHGLQNAANFVDLAVQPPAGNEQ